MARAHLALLAMLVSRRRVELKYLLIEILIQLMKTRGHHPKSDMIQLVSRILGC